MIWICNLILLCETRIIFPACSRFVRSPAVEDEEDSEESQPSTQHTINGNATNGLLEEGSPSECISPLTEATLLSPPPAGKQLVDPNRPSFPGEMEMDEQDDESSQDQELPSENDNSQSEDSVGGDNELENGVVTPQISTKVPQTAGHNRKRLFTFQFNNMGKTDFSLIKEDTKLIRFDEGHLRLSGRKIYILEAFVTLVDHQTFDKLLFLRFVLLFADRSYLSLDWEPEIKKKYFDETVVEVKLIFFILADRSAITIYWLS